MSDFIEPIAPGEQGVSFVQKINAAKDVANQNITVFNLAALKELDVPVGTHVRVLHHTDADDEGGGVFVLKNEPDFINNNTDRPGTVGETTFLQLAQPSKVSNVIGDKIRWSNGIDTETTDSTLANQSTTLNSLKFLESGTIEANATGFLIPEIEGLKAAPSNPDVNPAYYWERVRNGGSIHPEWFGIKKAKTTKDTSFDCAPILNKVLKRGYSLDFSDGFIYIQNTLEITRGCKLNGAGWGPHFIYTNKNRADDLSGTVIFTDQNIVLVDIKAPNVILVDIAFDCREITFDNNGEGFHDKFIIEYDQNFNTWQCSTERIYAIGNIDALLSGKGSNYMRYNTEKITDGVGRQAYFNHHYKDLAVNMNVGHQIDAENANSDISAIRCDITFLRIKQAYRWLSGSHNSIIGISVQTATILSWEERNTAMFYLRCGYLSIDVGHSDIANADPAESEESSEFTYPRLHNKTAFWDIGDTPLVIMNLMFRQHRNLNLEKDFQYIVGAPSYENTYNPQVILNGHVDVTHKNSALHNEFRDAHILHTVREGFLRGGPNFDDELVLDEQIGVLPSIPEWSHYQPQEGTNGQKLFEFASKSQPIVLTPQENVEQNDFYELVIEPSDIEGFSFDNIYLQVKGGCEAVQIIEWQKETFPSTTLINPVQRKALVKVDKVLRFKCRDSVYKYIFRFINPTSSSLVIQDIFAFSVNGFRRKTAPFIQRGDAPIMKSADGTYYKLEAPANGGGAATWIEL